MTPRTSISLLTSVVGLLPLLVQANSPFSLGEAYRSAFHIGVATNAQVYIEQDPTLSQLVRDEFNLVVAENDFKWLPIHPREGEYDFTKTDAMVEMAEAQGKWIHGHVLVWHSQTPDWVFQNASGGELTRDELIARMKDHIQTVVGRYKGRVHSWDVVNEAFEDDGTFRESPWHRIIGDDFIEIAFRAAREVDPNVMLIYNDYGWANDAKRQRILELVQGFQARGVPIDGLGIQGHWQLNYPSAAQIDTILSEAASTGLHLSVSELDIDVLPAAWEHYGADISTLYEYKEELNPYIERLPASVAEAQSVRYQEVFELFLRYQSNIHTITFWGITDRGSWLNEFPVRGRTNYPLLFDREGAAKSSYFRVLSIAPDASTPTTQSTDAYQPIALHRFSRPVNGSHFFTANEAEFASVMPFAESGILNYEGVSHYVVENHTLQSQPVYRLYNRLSGSHFYTANRDEMLIVLSNPNRVFSYEGIAFYVLLSAEPGTLPVYRFFAPPTGSHFFTISEAEKNALRGSNSAEHLSFDGVAWYAFPSNEVITP